MADQEPSYALPSDDLAFADLVSREMRGRVEPAERAALDRAHPADLERWLATLERFRDDVNDQLRFRAAQMEGLLYYGSRDVWERERPKYDEWRSKALRFQNVLVHRINGVRRKLRATRPGQMSSVALLRKGVELDPADAVAVETWQRAVRKWLHGASSEQGESPVRLVKPKPSSSGA